MSEVIFNCGGILNTIQCNQNDLIKDICQNYANKTKKKFIRSYFFI